MTSRENQLWELISTHQMPNDATGRSFLDQLMDEHRIKRDTALTAIEEYRKFIYLCVTRDARNVPSKAVDLVWHLHMQHSRDYWEVFCQKLGKPIHHSPGGEGRGHLQDYKATVAAYRKHFGTPPKGVWRQKHLGGDIFALLFLTPFVVIGLHLLMNSDAPLLFGLAFTALPFLVAGHIAYGMTARGEYSLTFEIGDPFSDDDAGDYGSGDGGGCGD